MKNSASNASTEELEKEYARTGSKVSSPADCSAVSQKLDPAEIASDVLFGDRSHSTQGREQHTNAVETELDIGSILFDVPVLDVPAENACIETAFDSFLETLLPEAVERTEKQVLSILDDIAYLVSCKREKLRRKAPQLPQPKTGSYECYPQDSEVQPLDWLEQHWGQWLKYYNSSLDRDYLYLDQLGKLDPDLKKALYAKRRSILSETGCQISEIIPKKSARIEYELEMADNAQLKNAMRLYGSPRARNKRKNSL